MFPYFWKHPHGLDSNTIHRNYRLHVEVFKFKSQANSLDLTTEFWGGMSWMFPENRGRNPKMDGENNGKPYLKWMIWGYHYFRKPPFISKKVFWIHGIKPKRSQELEHWSVFRTTPNRGIHRWSWTEDLPNGHRSQKTLPLQKRLRIAKLPLYGHCMAVVSPFSATCANRTLFSLRDIFTRSPSFLMC